MNNQFDLHTLKHKLTDAIYEVAYSKDLDYKTITDILNKVNEAFRAEIKTREKVEYLPIDEVYLQNADLFKVQRLLNNLNWFMGQSIIKLQAKEKLIKDFTLRENIPSKYTSQLLDEIKKMADKSLSFNQLIIDLMQCEQDDIEYMNVSNKYQSMGS